MSKAARTIRRNPWLVRIVFVREVAAARALELDISEHDAQARLFAQRFVQQFRIECNVVARP